jgi:glycosyltransferase
MKVSIITVCHNSEATLESTIRSVLSQNYKDIEFIVVDGRSTDGTAAIIDKYRSRISKFVSEKDEGMYHAINKGISLASGEIVGILNSDDIYSDERIISRIVKEFEVKKTDCIYGDLQYVARDNPNKIIRHWKSKPYNEKLFLNGWMPPHPTFFVRRECYSRYGLFNTSFSISADYELMLRFLYKNKISSSYIPEVLVKMSVGGISNKSIQSRIKANKEDRRAWEINGLKPNSFTLIIKPLSKLRQFID